MLIDPSLIVPPLAEAAPEAEALDTAEPLAAAADAAVEGLDGVVAADADALATDADAPAGETLAATLAGVDDEVEAGGEAVPPPQAARDRASPKLKIAATDDFMSLRRLLFPVEMRILVVKTID